MDVACVCVKILCLSVCMFIHMYKSVYIHTDKYVFTHISNTGWKVVIKILLNMVDIFE
jgi:DNA-binding ferritin-like protein (Dps family)